MNASAATTVESELSVVSSSHSGRAISIDALRGLIIFTMIFVNDIAGVSKEIVPEWMRHFHGKSGMTFVDLVFPAFLFIVGMAIPFALGSRLRKGEPLWKTIGHVLVRTISLLAIGILMVNGTPDSGKLGWSGTLWETLMYTCAILAFCSLSPPRTSGLASKNESTFRVVSTVLRAVGLIALVYLAFAFRGKQDQRIISLSPFSIQTSWYGILGLIGWAYLVGSAVYLLFRTHRTALLGCTALLLCMYAADRTGAFQGFWLARYVGLGGTLGSQASITVAGLLLASILVSADTNTISARIRFTLAFIAGCAATAWQVNGLYGINKNSATPSWCLWACAITATLWLIFYCISEVWRLDRVARPFAIAGQNVLLAYLISEVLPSTLDLVHLGDWYSRLAEPTLAHAVARSAGCALVILGVTAGLNRAGFRLRL